MTLFLSVCFPSLSSHIISQTPSSAKSAYTALFGYCLSPTFSSDYTAQNAFMDKSADTSTIQQLRDKLMQTLKDRADLVKENVELDKRNADLNQVRA